MDYAYICSSRIFEKESTVNIISCRHHQKFDTSIDEQDEREARAEARACFRLLISGRILWWYGLRSVPLFCRSTFLHLGIKC